MTLVGSPDKYQSIEMLPCGSGAVLLRKTLTAQVLLSPDYGEEVFHNLAEKLKEMPWNQLIVNKEILYALKANGLDFNLKEGSYMAICSPSDFKDLGEKNGPEPLKIGDLDQVVQVYEKVFKGFSSASYMMEKLKAARGRGYVIKNEDGQIVSLAQSDFETDQMAVIVGVATEPAEQGKGYGTQCLIALCRELISEKKTMGLIYENEKAGLIYERLGFKRVDQLYHLERKSR